MNYFLIILTFFVPLAYTFDLVTYKNDYQAQVAVPYKTAVSVVSSSIIEYLALTPVPKTASGGKLILASLTAQAHFFSTNLGSASSASDILRNNLDREIENLVAQAAAVEKQLQDNEKQIQQVNGQIQEQTAKVTDAQNRVNQAQAAERHAEDVLRQEEQRVHDAEHCTHGIIDFVCPIINHGGIKNAEHARDNARGDLRGYQQRLSSLQTELNQYQQQLANFQQQRTNLETRKTQLNAQLSTLNLTRNNVVKVDVQLKAVIAHVSTLFGKSQVLLDVINHLIDMETVITPITAIADQIMSFTPNAADVTFLSAMKEKISLNLPLVMAKLPDYGLIPPSD